MKKKKRTRRKSTKGRTKGQIYEREVCKQLSLWWTDGKRDDVFWRSANSGATATSRTKKKRTTFGQYGDVQAIDPIGQPLIDMFTIEIKRGYSNFTIQDIFDKPEHEGPSETENFIEQAAKSSMEAGTPAWMIIVRRDRKDAVTLLKRTKKIKHILDLLRGHIYPHGTFNFYNKSDTKFHRVFVTTLSNLFEIDPDKFKD
jgi:hypothetical protein